MAKFAFISLLSCIFFTSAIQAIQVINNTSGVASFAVMACRNGFMNQYDLPQRYEDVQPGTTSYFNVLDFMRFNPIVTIKHPDSTYFQFEIGKVNENDTISFVELDYSIIALIEHEGQVIKRSLMK